MAINLYSVIFLIFLSAVCQAQQESQPLRYFATQYVQERVEAEQQEVIVTRSEIERKTATFNRFSLFKRATLPVVFHIIYSPGQHYPNEDQINAQLQALNRDFGGVQPTSLMPVKESRTSAVDTEISFCVPAKNPQGKKTTGINFVLSDTTEWSLTDAMKFHWSGGMDAWDPLHYINVWIVNLADGVSGWAQMPGGPQLTDGIVIDYRLFGVGGTAEAPYNEGKTLTHLMGSYFNLYELWSERSPCGDDYVDDTPVHNGPNYACHDGENQISLCYGSPVELTINFMDNTPDACMYAFTDGQKQRMQATIAEGGPREELITGEIKCGRPPATSDHIEYLIPGASITSSELTATENAGPQLALYPNPATERITLSIDLAQETGAEVVIYDILGRVVFTKQWGEPEARNVQTEVNVSSWKAGTYYLYMTTTSYHFTEKLVVQTAALRN